VAGRGKERRKDIFCREYLKERNHLENLDLDGWRILKWLFKKHNGGVDRIYLAQDRVDGVILWKE